MRVQHKESGGLVRSGPSFGCMADRILCIYGYGVCIRLTALVGMVGEIRGY